MVKKGRVTTIHVHKRATADMLALGTRRLDQGCLSWSSNTAKAFMEEYVFFDGWAGKTGHRRLLTVDKEQAVWLHTLAFVAGNGHQWGWTKHGTGFNPNATVYQIQLNNRTGVSIRATTKKLVGGTHRVICPNVASGFFVVKRNNKIYVTGNSNYNGQASTPVLS